MTGPRAIVMAGGADTKWTELGGAGRRHLQLIGGETVLARIVRQLAERGVADIVIVGPDLPGYSIAGTVRTEPDHSALWGHEALNAQSLWSTEGRTIQVYGDTIFTDHAMDAIAGFGDRAWQLFGRHEAGGISPWGELFAVSFWPEHHGQWLGALQQAFDLKRNGVIRRAGSWEAYRILGGAVGPIVARHRRYPGLFTEIDDSTDDFDTPEEYAALIASMAVAA